MQVKLNRGPMKNKRVVAPDDSYRYLVRMPKNDRIDWTRLDDDDPLDFTQFREGEYHKGFTRLKDGTVLFEWMGWRDGKV